VGSNNDVLETETTKRYLTHRLTDKHGIINRGLLSWRRMEGGGVGGAGRVTIMAKKRSMHWFSVGKTEGRRSLSRLGVDGRLI
jgi:hypothetical protein